MASAVDTIELTRDFSPYPAGRFRRDGRYSGEGFREDVLWPKLSHVDTGTKILLDIDGVAGLPSSFWEEVFGGLVRNHDIDADTVLRLVEVKTSESDLRPYVELAYRFVRDAELAKSKNS